MKVLLATDGSNFSEAAVQAIASQMRPEIAEVLLLQVVERSAFPIPPQMAPGYAPEKDEVLKEQFRQAQGSVDRAKEVLRSTGFRVSGRVIDAEIRTGILDVAAEWHADLIVLGSHGRRGIKRFLLGSVAEAVAHNAPCSVMIVRVRPTS